jgi:hypothetical protein
LERTDEVEKDEEYHLGQDVEDHYRRWLQLQSAHRRPAQSHLSKKEKEGENVLLERAIKKHQLPTFGYVTQDKCPGDGDDVIHQPLPSFDQPEYVATGLPPAADKVDVVFFRQVISYKNCRTVSVQSSHQLSAPLLLLIWITSSIHPVLAPLDLMIALSLSSR